MVAVDRVAAIEVPIDSCSVVRSVRGGERPCECTTLTLRGITHASQNALARSKILEKFLASTQRMAPEGGVDEFIDHVAHPGKTWGYTQISPRRRQRQISHLESQESLGNVERVIEQNKHITSGHDI